MTTPNQENQRQDGDGQGGKGGGPILEYLTERSSHGHGRTNGHLRQHAKQIIQLLRFQRENGQTIFTEDEVVGLIRGGGMLATAAMRDGKQREYAVCMKILMEAVRLDQVERERGKPVTNEQHVHLHGESMAERVERIMDKLTAEESPQGQ